MQLMAEKRVLEEENAALKKQLAEIKQTSTDGKVTVMHKVPDVETEAAG